MREIQKKGPKNREINASVKSVMALIIENRKAKAAKVVTQDLEAMESALSYDQETPAAIDDTQNPQTL
jgi:hypothetical protein